MSTKSASSGKKNRSARRAVAAQRTAAGGEATASPPADTAARQKAPGAKKERPSLSLRTSILPSAGVGVIVLILSMQEGAPFWVAAVVGVLIAAAIVGMLALKRGLYGN